ncbi:MAG: hypothetical protein KH315_11570, partial [Faecalibacterium prausnitzii]|nr:hypothetical protein [Faecalibacterium prausnitzii]
VRFTVSLRTANAFLFYTDPQGRRINAPPVQARPLHWGGCSWVAIRNNTKTEEKTMKMTDGKKTVEITMKVWNDFNTGYSPNWSNDFFQRRHLALR